MTNASWPCLNTHQIWVICLLPAKNKIYRYFTYVSVILRSGCTFQYAILHIIFVLRSHCNPSRASILTPSYHYMHANFPCTEITSRNAKISTLDPNNFFWLRIFIPNLTKILTYIYVYNTLPEFAPFLSSLKKFQFVKNPL